MIRFQKHGNFAYVPQQQASWCCCRIAGECFRVCCHVQRLQAHCIWCLKRFWLCPVLQGRCARCLRSRWLDYESDPDALGWRRPADSFQGAPTGLMRSDFDGTKLHLLHPTSKFLRWLHFESRFRGNLELTFRRSASGAMHELPIDPAASPSCCTCKPHRWRVSHRPQKLCGLHATSPGKSTATRRGSAAIQIDTPLAMMSGRVRQSNGWDLAISMATCREP